MSFMIAEAVGREALYVLRGGDGDDTATKEVVDLEPVLNAGLLSVVRIESEEEGLDYIALAAELDDGEAMSCAIAKHRGYAVATDDRKAQNVLRRMAPRVAILTTPELLKHWSESTGIDSVSLQQVLVDVQERGRFVPRTDDPHRSWWDAVLSTSGRRQQGP